GHHEGLAAEGHLRGPERLAAAGLRGSLSAGRPPPLLLQALRGRQRAVEGGRAHETPRGGRAQGTRPGADAARRDVREEKEVAVSRGGGTLPGPRTRRPCRAPPGTAARMSRAVPSRPRAS